MKIQLRASRRGSGRLAQRRHVAHPGRGESAFAWLCGDPVFADVAPSLR